MWEIRLMLDLATLPVTMRCLVCQEMRDCLTELRTLSADQLDGLLEPATKFRLADTSQRCQRLSVYTGRQNGHRETAP